jgi:hypothetical protein
MVPSTPGYAPADGSDAMLSPDRRKAPPDPCDIATTWTFKGSCAPFALKSSGGTVKLKAYLGLTVTTTFGANNAKGTQTLIMGDAFDKGGDITPPTAGKEKGKPFPAYGKNCVTSSQSGTKTKCPGSAVNYAEVVNPNKNAIKLDETPQIVETYTKGFPAKSSCFLAALTATGAWSLQGELLATPPKGKTLKFSSFPQSFTFPGKSPAILATVCSS